MVLLVGYGLFSGSRYRYQRMKIQNETPENEYEQEFRTKIKIRSFVEN